MILSVKHNYIYIRTPKTASTTIKAVLTDDLGPDDVVVTSATSSLGMVQKPGTTLAGVVMGAHIAAAEIKPLICEDFWNGAFKFTSVRHPYEKAVSLAYYRFAKREKRIAKRGRQPDWETLEQCLDLIVRRGSCASYRMYTVDDMVVVSDFIRTETVEADLRRLGALLGFAVPSELPCAKQGFRRDRRPAREILSIEQRHRIYECCRREFDLLGYEP